MKSKEYGLQLLDDAIDDYFDASDDLERIIAVAQMNVLEDMLEVKEIPLCMKLRLDRITFEILMREYEDVSFCFK